MLGKHLGDQLRLRNENLVAAIAAVAKPDGGGDGWKTAKSPRDDDASHTERNFSQFRAVDAMSDEGLTRGCLQGASHVIAYVISDGPGLSLYTSSRYLTKTSNKYARQGASGFFHALDSTIRMNDILLTYSELGVVHWNDYGLHSLELHQVREVYNSGTHYGRWLGTRLGGIT